MYEIPKPTFELLSPKGFCASIPDEPGLKIFAFHGTINRRISNPEPGDFSDVVTSAINQKWIYDNKFIEILPNDTLNYWFYIQQNNKSFQINHETYPIGQAKTNNDYINYQTTTEIPIDTNYNVPIPTIKRLYPRGFRVSIPDVYGIKIVAFHSQLNDKIGLYKIGDFNQIISAPNNGEWIYVNNDIEIHTNDILSYWMYVQHGRRGLTLPVNNYQFTNDTKLFDMTRNSTNIIPNITVYNDNHNYDSYQNSIISNSIDQICDESITMVTGYKNKICKGHIIFEDKFNRYDNEKWEEEIQFSGIDGQFVLYDDRSENLYVKDGKLNIIPTLTVHSEYKMLRRSFNLENRCTNNNLRFCERILRIPPILSSKINTKKSFSFRYGQIDIRAKLPIGDWTFPEIFLEPLNNKYGQKYASGQIRIAFIRGNEFLESKEGEKIDGHRLYGGVIIDNNENLYDIWLKTTDIYPEHFGTDFHNYSLIWTNEYIRMEVDGIPYGNKIRGDFIKSAHGKQLKYATTWMNGTKLAPFDEEFYISLGVGVGGKLNFPDGIENGATKDNPPKPKPWLNSHTRTENKFWDDRNEWRKTWSTNNTKLIVDYIRVYAL